MAVFQPQGGFLEPEKCIVACVTAAQARGAEVHGQEQVLDWKPLAHGVRVRTDRATYEAGKLVFTAGAWSSKLVDVLAHEAVPERQALAWFQPLRPAHFTPDKFPVFNLLVEEGRYYGFPVHGIPGFKIGRYHHLHENVDPDTVDRQTQARDEAVLRLATAKYFPDAAGPTLTLKTCMFTNSKDEHFILDLHPEYPQVAFAAGFSGHGFKFCSVIGEIMTDLAQKGDTAHDIAMFRWQRLAKLSWSRSAA
jgi:sarcosine oxidase